MFKIAKLVTQIIWEGNNKKGEELVKISEQATTNINNLQESLKNIKSDESFEKLAESAKLAKKYLTDYSKAISTRDDLTGGSLEEYNQKRLSIVQNYLQRRKVNLTQKQRGALLSYDLKKLRDLRETYKISERKDIEGVYQRNLDKVQEYEDTKTNRNQKISNIKKEIEEQKKIKKDAKKQAQEQKKAVYESIRSFSSLDGVVKNLSSKLNLFGATLVATAILAGKAWENISKSIGEEIVESKLTNLDNAEIERRATALESMGVGKNIKGKKERREFTRGLVSKMERMSQKIAVGRTPTALLETPIDPVELTSFEGTIKALQRTIGTAYHPFVSDFIESNGLSSLLAIPEGTDVNKYYRKSLSGVTNKQLENANRSTNFLRPFGANVNTLGRQIGRGVIGSPYNLIDYAKNLISNPKSGGNLYYTNSVTVHTDNSEAVKEALSDKIDTRIMMDNGGER